MGYDPAERCPEFDCRECGRHIVQLTGPRPALDGSDRCAACWSLPGWFRDPELARAIDPDNTRTMMRNDIANAPRTDDV